MGGRFVDVGPLADVGRRHPQLKPIDLPQHLLMPGFVDAHHHLTQSFGKALAFGEPSEIFRRIWVPLESSLDAESLYLSAKLAALEALRGGFTTVCDAGTRAAEGLDAVAAATRDAGVRCVLGQICNDDGSRHAEVLAEAEKFLGHSNSLLHPSLAVSIPEVATDAMLHAASRLCAEAGAVFQVHVNEHLASVERSLVARGLRPLQHLGAAGALGPQALLAHCTMLAPDELMLLRDSGSAVAINPVASQWKGNAVAPTGLLAAMQVRLGLGTDGTRSDGFRMMDAGEADQRIAFGLASGDSSCGGGRLWLDLATRGGADAAGLGAHHRQRRGRQGRRLPARRPRRAGADAVMGPELGAGPAGRARSDRVGARRRAPAPLARLAGRLGCARAARGSAAHCARQRRAGADPQGSSGQRVQHRRGVSISAGHGAKTVTKAVAAGLRPSHATRHRAHRLDAGDRIVRIGASSST